MYPRIYLMSFTLRICDYSLVFAKDMKNHLLALEDKKLLRKRSFELQCSLKIFYLFATKLINPHFSILVSGFL